jgi:DNA-binding transcriptional ArsR family regulator/rhodanese-related sulfurtransferase
LFSRGSPDKKPLFRTLFKNSFEHLIILGYLELMEGIHLQTTAAFCQALSSPVRLRALNFLAQGPWPVGRLADELGRSVASTSAHLQSLKAASLVVTERFGQEVRYRVTSIEVLRALSAVQAAAAATSPAFREWAQEMRNDPYLMPEQDMGQLSKRLAVGKTLMMDLRTRPEFECGHLPGAVSRPFETLKNVRLEDYRGFENLIGYCRGLCCQKARLGVEFLNQAGLPVQRLPGGVVEWQIAGLPLDKGPAMPETKINHN